MNAYCNYLNFPHIDIDLSVYKKNKRNQIRVPKDVIGVELNNILHKLNISIQWVEVFYLGPDADHSIHCDGHELDNKAKLNYIIGGKNSVMSWYRPISEDKIEKRTSPANTIYLGINIKDVVETYNTTMKDGFYLVNVGEFHNVWNKYEDRYCLSACPVDNRTSHRLNFNELQQRLKDYINE
jgi:hypothetical protein